MDSSSLALLSLGLSILVRCNLKKKKPPPPHPPFSRYLAEILPRNTTLHKLYLGYNDIRDDGVSLLCLPFSPVPLCIKPRLPAFHAPLYISGPGASHQLVFVFVQESLALSKDSLFRSRARARSLAV